MLGCLVDEINANTYSAQTQRLFCNGWYEKSSYGPTISRLLSVGDIEKIQKNGETYYRLSSKGSERIKENISISKLSNRTWDGNWRLVIFDIEEKYKKTREALRFKLISLGFGMWQESIYITPFDIEQEINQFLITKKIFPWAVCLVARRSDLGDDKELVNKVWNLEKINESYNQFANECQKLIEEKNTIDTFKNLWLNYQKIIFDDPHLPKELLPKDWGAGGAKKLFSRLCRLSLTENFAVAGR